MIMTIDDIRYIFESQIASGEEKLWFMLIDGNYKLVERHPAEKIDDLVFLLDNFIYSGNENNIPRFSK